VRLGGVRLESFRGLRRARVELGRTTVLIGENGCGKSTLLDALALVLGAGGPGPEALGASDFFRPGGAGRGERLRIGIALAEGRDGELSGERLAPLQDFARSDGSGRKHVELCLEAQLGDAGVEHRWLFLEPDGAPIGEAPAAAVAVVRALSPVVLLRGGLVVGHGDPGDGVVAEREALGSRIEDLYTRVVESRRGGSERELRAGIEAARALLAAAGDGGEAGASVPTLRRLLGGGAARAHGSGARSLGGLLLLGALLEAHAEELDPAAQPTLVIEEPEAHLHPLTLASVWAVLENVRLQKLVSTHSAELVSAVPLSVLRRLTRRDGEVSVRALEPGSLEDEELRKVRYHVRARRGGALFARCWLLIEGETEFWMLPELARRSGFQLDVEGVACVEFAQCGVSPLVKLAEVLGIEWHLLTDGDGAGRGYAESARRLLGDAPAETRLTLLAEADLEHCLWRNGYADVYREAAGLGAGKSRRSVRARSVIGRAVRRTSKPHMALAVLDALAREGSPGVPRPLREVVEKAVALARGGLAAVAARPPRRRSRRRRRRSRR
jgi:putative ATP-dependent endonuclease of OLD family